MIIFGQSFQCVILQKVLSTVADVANSVLSLSITLGEVRIDGKQ